jgi:hypothetical protein
VTPDEMQAEIDQLRRQILIFVDMVATWVKVGHENERLQDAIERVRALHGPTFDGTRCVACSMPDGDFELRPCPTIRALDGNA